MEMGLKGKVGGVGGFRCEKCPLRFALYFAVKKTVTEVGTF